MVVLNDFVLFLKQESGSRVQGSKVQGSKARRLKGSKARRLEGSKARRMKKAFSKVLHAKSKVKEFLNFFQIQEI